MTSVKDNVAAIAAAIITHDGKVLMVKRRVSEGQLSWQFPAGAVETGEADEDAAVRETREEAGIVVRPARVLGRRVHPATGRDMVYVACDFVEGEAFVADTEELDEVAWCTKEMVTQLVPYPLFGPVQTYLDELLSLPDAEGGSANYCASAFIAPILGID